MKKSLVFILAVAMVFALYGCCMIHDWVEADCITQKHCQKCGETEGEPPLGHFWEAATLEQPSTCSVCGETRGEPAQACSVCEMSGYISCDNCNELGQVTCSVCCGSKVETCSGCDGSGTVNCTSCKGSGKGEYYDEYRCYKCGGNGQARLTCKNCGGAGFVFVGFNSIEDCLKCNATGSVYEECVFCLGTGTYKSYNDCNQCDGVGTVKDDQCDGEGNVPCINCNENGMESCPLCKKNKQLICDNCEGTGLIQSVDISSNNTMISTQWSADVVAFNTDFDDTTTIMEYAPTKADQLHVLFQINGEEKDSVLDVSYIITYQNGKTWNSSKSQPIKNGNFLRIPWENGWDAAPGTMKITIVRSDTNENIGEFSFEIK